MAKPMILANDKALVGQDISAVLDAFRSQPDVDLAKTQFKKKEILDDLPKSILKHRIQNLTGKNMPDLEKELGFDLMKDGRGMPVEGMRRLAHLLILDAHGEELPKGTAVKATDKKPGMKRGHSQVEVAEEPAAAEEEEEEVAPVVKRPRSTRKSLAPAALAAPKRETVKRGRKSLAPEIMREATEQKPKKKANGSSVACRLKPDPVAEEMEVDDVAEKEDEEDEEEPEDPTLGLDNPTPAMLALKRKSIGVAKLSKTPSKAKNVVANGKAGVAKTKIPAREKAVVVKQKPAPKIKVIPARNGFTGARYQVADGKKAREGNGEIFLLNSEPTTALKGPALRKAIPAFKGANLSVVHTPTDWQPTDVFNVVQSIRGVNRDAKLSTYLVLVGCGLSNVHMFREALYRQTKHVQFVVFERDDQGLAGTNEDDDDDGKLRETTSFFLLAYFFPGSDKEGSSLPARMVRPGMTTCFHTKSIEDLENSIVLGLSEEGDWILDLCCKSRELSLSAQKTGRFAIAVEQEVEKLAVLQEKAAGIAKHYDESFREGTDGNILRI